MPDTIDNQINYKLGKIEASVESLTTFMKSYFANLEQKLDESNKRTDGEVAAIQVRHEMLDKKVNELQTRLDGLYVKGGFLVTAVSLFWVAFGDMFKTFL